MNERGEFDRQNLLSRLILRRDVVWLEGGRFFIKARSGLPVNRVWLNQRLGELQDELVSLMPQAMYRYQRYSVGRYGEGWDGLTLHFERCSDGKEFFACFNVNRRRQRCSKHGKRGELLPKGQFRVAKNGAFVKFWKGSGLLMPRRLAAFPDYMGNLTPIIFIGEVVSDAGKFDNKTLRPASVSYEDIFQVVTGRSQTIYGQSTDNLRTNLADKERAEILTNPNVLGDLSTCEDERIKSKQGSTYNSADRSLCQGDLSPQEQDNEVWLDRYSSAPRLQ